MAWTKLPTDYTDAIWNGNRKYNMINNSDGTVSFEDVTEYYQKENSFFGATEANQMNAAMNEFAENMDTFTETVESFSAAAQESANAAQESANAAQESANMIANDNLVPNILPLVEDTTITTSSNSVTLCAKNLLGNGETNTVAWKMITSALNEHYLYVGSIGDDEDYDGSCFKYIGYNLPGDVGNHCVAFYTELNAPKNTKFKAGEYTLSFYIKAIGSSNVSPLLKTVAPTVNDSVGTYGGDDLLTGIIINKWIKVSKTVTIEEETNTLYLVLDSTSKNTATNKTLLFADIKLEYDSRATDYNSDYATELLLNSLNLEDISKNFITGKQDESLNNVEIEVYKQGNLISGIITIGINPDKVDENEAILQISSKYKPKQSLVMPQFFAIDSNSTFVTEEINYLQLSRNDEGFFISFNDYNVIDISISFCYICN